MYSALGGLFPCVERSAALKVPSLTTQNQSYDEITFGNLVDLASAAMFGKAISASDDFFASKDMMLAPGAAVFDPHAYTERGKLMDGWESARTRRASALPDRDECVVRLGVPGTIHAVNVDTHFFLGNHPPFAKLEGTRAPWGASSDDLAKAEWSLVLGACALKPGSHNVFTVSAAASQETFSHVRLTMYPDGGIARLRVFGKPVPRSDTPQDSDAYTAKHVPPGLVDLVAARMGGRALACSDMFFGRMENLLLPGRAANMSSGWETRRRRSPGFDWVLLELSRPGVVRMLEVDTNHFRGNYPDDIRIEGVLASGLDVVGLTGDRAPWKEVLTRSPLSPHERHWFELDPAVGALSHMRISVYPDGGISRFRAWGAWS